MKLCDAGCWLQLSPPRVSLNLAGTSLPRDLPPSLPLAAITAKPTGTARQIPLPLSGVADPEPDLGAGVGGSVIKLLPETGAVVTNNSFG
jgi:hypothetical protein